MKEFINIEKIIRDKNPRLAKLLPGFVLRYIKKIIHEKDVNVDLNALEGLETKEKFTTFIRNQNVEIEVVGEENVPKEGRYIFASNHPLGGMDGILFYAVLRERYDGAKFLVNDVLMNLPGVEDAFIPTNTLGKNTRENLVRLDEAFQSDEQMLIFPAGHVSRKINGKIQDIEWKKSFVNYAKKYERNVIPVHINAVNSKFFYNLANFRTKIGIKANLEMFFLVDELYKKRNSTIQIIFGEAIPYTAFDSSKNVKEWASYVKEKSYKLASKLKA